MEDEFHEGLFHKDTLPRAILFQARLNGLSLNGLLVPTIYRSAFGPQS